MKRKLGIGVLFALLFLSACQSNTTVTCTDVDGNVLRAYEEGGELTRFVSIETEDVSHLDEEELAFLLSLFEAMDEVEDIQIEDGELSVTMTIDAEVFLALVGQLDLETFVENREALGDVCES